MSWLINFFSSFLFFFSSPIFIKTALLELIRQVFASNSSGGGNARTRRERFIPPFFKLHHARSGVHPSRSSLDGGGGRGDVHVLSRSSLLSLLGRLGRLLLGRDILANGLGLVTLWDGLSLRGGLLVLLLLTLHGLAGLTEETTELVALSLRLALTGLLALGLLLDTQSTKDGGALLVLRGLGRGGPVLLLLLGSLSIFDRGSLTLGLLGRLGRFLDGVVQLRSGAGDGGLLLGLLLSRAGDLVEEVAEDAGTLGLLVLLLVLLLLLFLLVFSRLSRGLGGGGRGFSNVSSSR